ncbi:hypothetical protein LVD17_00265 [Fulvivirga ulvae]|uniref:hypothetical protein n=1 Tax=Fulvivirga ulvae TaxID=2904245 RepID=UPI001F3A7DE7|nr:hypothetical protein [Fulvivirga ulvae]UII32270.1 hypothetical protein LVD17_00265 [Fulvivirga ulvae]
MATPRAKTLQQKLGFLDDDLRKPLHDDLMLWLDNNIETVVNHYFRPTKNEIEIQKEDQFKRLDEVITYQNNLIEREGRVDTSLNALSLRESLKSSSEDHVGNSNNESSYSTVLAKKKLAFIDDFKRNHSIPECPFIRKIEKKWELPITTNNVAKYGIGFIDYAASFNIPKLYLYGLQRNERINSRDYVGIEEDRLKFGFEAHKHTIYIEVKTEIKSLGELIRQINLYKVYQPGEYYVLCPNNEFKETLAQQNIGFIECPYPGKYDSQT